MNTQNVLLHILQTIRTGNQFTAEVRLLVGRKKFVECTQLVKVFILPCEQAYQLDSAKLKAHLDEENKYGVINNNNGTFGNQKNICDKSLVNFDNLQLQKIKRVKANECVAEDLYSFVFHANITCFDLQIQLWTTSLPITVVSHPSQRLKATTAVVWNNVGVSAFEMQKKAPWKQVN